MRLSGDSQGLIPVHSSDINADLAFYRRLGFTVSEVFPADAPSRAVIRGLGLTLALDPGAVPLPCLRIPAPFAATESPLVSPGGTRVEFVHRSSRPIPPRLESSLVVSRRPDVDVTHAGRAGMKYHDLVPGRQGDCVIASLISIPVAGTVDDWVHFHEIDFQLIFVKSGWVTVVYEGQGPEFTMVAGDCVIQPPGIRHRVLANSDHMEVIEVGYPAEHLTRSDPATGLPGTLQPTRTWRGQHFIRHQRSSAVWQIVDGDGSPSRADTGVSHATNSLASVDITRSDSDATWMIEPVENGVFTLLVALDGAVSVTIGTDHFDLREGDSVVVPVGESCSVRHLGRAEVLRVLVDTVHNGY